jgi:hypothetical protein
MKVAIGLLCLLFAAVAYGYIDIGDEVAQDLDEDQVELCLHLCNSIERYIGSLGDESCDSRCDEIIRAREFYPFPVQQTVRYAFPIGNHHPYLG